MTQSAGEILVVAGTRPELIKLAPVVRDLKTGGARVTYLLTGQHTDDIMAGAAIWGAGLQWPQPDEVLSIDRGHTRLTDPDPARGERALAQAVRLKLLAWQKGRPNPGAVLVQGDTASALGGAWFAKHINANLVHLEAGLRCWDDSVPEERIRREIDSKADLLLCPSRMACAFAAVDAGPEASVVPVGQTGLQALSEAAMGQQSAPTSSVPWALLTLHRAAWDQRGDVMDFAAAAAEGCVNAGVECWWPVHPRWNYEPIDGINATQPIPYGTMAKMLMGANVPRLIITDSGGLIEEAYFCGIPTITVRPSTERWEAIMAGASMLCPPSWGSEHLRAATADMLKAKHDVKYGSEYDCPYPSMRPSEACATSVLAKYHGE